MKTYRIQCEPHQLPFKATELFERLARASLIHVGAYSSTIDGVKVMLVNNLPRLLDDPK